MKSVAPPHATNARLLCRVLLLSPVIAALSACADDTEIEYLRAEINSLADQGRNAEILPWVDRLLTARAGTLGGSHPDVARTFITYAQTHERLGATGEAERWYQAALDLLEKVAPGKEELAFGLTQYGWFLKDRGKLDRAEPMLTRALEIREKVLGLNDSETAWSVRNLAWVVRRKGDFPRAITLFERCDQLRERVRGPLHVETLNNLADLGSTHVLAGQIDRAIEIMREVIARQERATGSESAELASRLITLGGVFRDQRRFAEGVAVYQRAISIRERVGEAHADTLAAIHSLAWCLHASGQNEEAESAFRRAVTLSLKLHGKNHPDTVEVQRSLATFFMNRKRNAEFLETARSVAEMGERVYGSDHQKVYEFRSLLARAFEVAGDRRAAADLHQKMLAFRRAHPSDDKALIDELLTTAEAYSSSGDQAQAAPLREEALGLLRRTTPEDAARISNTMGALAASKEALEQWAQAETLRRENLSYATEKLGAGSNEARQALTDLGWLFKQQKRFEEAEPLLRRVVEIAAQANGRQHSSTAWALRNLALLLKDKGQLEEARQPFEEAVAIRRAMGDTTSPDALRTIGGCADLLERMKLYADAAPLRREVLASREKTLGVDHADTISARRALAWLCSKIGRFAEGEKLYREAVDATTRTFGPEHAETLSVHQRLANLYKQWERYPQAIELYDKVFQARRRLLGPADDDTLDVMHDLITALRKMKDFARAEPLAKEHFKLTAQSQGAEDPRTASAAVTVAATLADMERWKDAEEYYHRALSIREKRFGAESKEASNSCVNLGWCAREQRDFAKSESYYQRALAIRTKVLGPTHRDTIDVLDDLGYLRKAQQDFAGALHIFEQELAALEKAGPAAASKIIDCLKELAGLNGIFSNLPAAESQMTRALELTRQVFGDAHENIVACESGLAIVAITRGDFAAAAPHARRAFEVSEKVYGPEAQQTAAALSTLGTASFYLGDLAGASSAFERALAMQERVPDVNPTSFAMTMGLAAICDLQIGRVAVSIQRGERALSMMEKAWGKESPLLFTPLYLLSISYAVEGRREEALAVARRNYALNRQSLGEQGYQTSTAQTLLGALEFVSGEFESAKEKLASAAKGNEAAIGLRNPITAMCWMYHAACAYSAGDVIGSTSSALKNQEALEGVLENVLSFGSEKQRLDWQAQSNPFALLAALNHAPGMARAVLRNKGIVLDSLIEDRRVAKSVAGSAFEGRLQDIRQKKARLFQLSMEVPKDANPLQLQQRATEQESLAKAVAEQESELARHVTALGRTRAALAVTPEEVRAVLRADVVLVEFVRVDRPGFVPGGGGQSYGAVVFTRDAEPRWIDLGAADEIDALVQRFQLSARRKTDQTALAQVLHKLHDKVWAPVAEAFPATVNSVVLCPDGELNFVSFATLLDAGDRFLAERFTIRYAGSGRDLLKESKINPERSMAIFADPQFNRPVTATSDKSALLNAAQTRDFQIQQLLPLPATAREAREIESIAEKAKWHTQLFAGAEASEPNLTGIRAPRILHIASHGFFLPEIARVAPANELLSLLQIPGAQSQTLENPMRRSGIALTGAQSTLEAWARGSVPSPGEDGVVSAEEVGTLDLEGTWLVALSACETGSGAARTGEGVMGLRRSFAQAGAQNLLLTLWTIEDETSAQIMAEFYAAACRTDNAASSLAEVQRAWLKKLRTEHGLLDAVNLAGPFVLNSTGKP